MDEELKVGDKVIISEGNVLGRTESIGEVEKVTGTQIRLTNGKRYMKSTYDEFGGNSHICKANEEMIERVNKKNTIKNAFSMLRNTKEMSYAMACDIISVYKKYGKDGELV